MRGAYEKSGGDYDPFADPINGDMAEDGITLAADFLYADHSSVANPGDSEPEWVRGDAAAFPDYIAGRELYGNNSYAQIRGGELAELNIE